MSLLEDEKDRIFGWSLLKTNLEVIIQFKQGNRYEGSLLRCRMNGHGKFFWAEGSTYEVNEYFVFLKKKTYFTSLKWEWGNE